MENSGIIGKDSLVVRNDKKFITSPIGDEIVMMSMESGNYIGINKMGTEIWQRLEHPTTVKSLIGYLLDVYDIKEEECSGKTIKYLNDMLAANMIVLLQS